MTDNFWEDARKINEDAERVKRCARDLIEELKQLEQEALRRRINNRIKRYL